MAIRKIARMGHPVLLQVSNAIADPGSPEVAALLQDMEETLEDIEGLGIAAPQVYEPVRIVIFHAPLDDSVDFGSREELRQTPLTRIVNPEWEPIGEEQVERWESCLSVPGMRGRVRRPEKIRYVGVTPEGKIIDRRVDGYHARVVQHEIDHLDGFLYPMRMDDMKTFMFETEFERHRR